MLRALEATIYFTFFLTALTKYAYAYLDPGTGSMILQGVLAAVAGSMFFLRTYWYKVKSFFSGDSSEEKSAPAKEDEDS